MAQRKKRATVRKSKSRVLGKMRKASKPARGKSARRTVAKAMPKKRLGARPDRHRGLGICCTVAASGGLCEGEKFQEIVGGADHGPLGTYFVDAAQQKLAEAACLFDLSEHGSTTCFLNR